MHGNKNFMRTFSLRTPDRRKWGTFWRKEILLQIYLVRFWLLSLNFKKIPPLSNALSIPLHLGLTLGTSAVGHFGVWVLHVQSFAQKLTQYNHPSGIIVI
jgi:hypothetical protein